MALKPIPKAILIATVVGGVVFGGINLLPKQEPKTEVAPVAPLTVAPPTQAQVEAARHPEADAAPAPAVQPAEQAPRPNVSSGDAGLNAVLGAGR